MTKMIIPQTAWTNFWVAFCTALDEADKTKFLKAWQNKLLATKTAYYEGTFMPALGKRVGYKLQIEKHRCDYAFLNPDGVPIIFIEAENKHSGASHEIRSLCCLAAPLKVLVISCDWQATEKQEFLPRWCEIIRMHHAVISMDCLYAVIVGEWDEQLKYSFDLVDTGGNVIGKNVHIAKS